MRNAIMIAVIGCIVVLAYVSADKGSAVLPGTAVSGRDLCTPKDIEIKSWQATLADRCSTESCIYVKIVGEAVNHCAHATGARVRITARDSNGGIVAEAERSLINARNISQGSYAFDLSDPFDYQKNMVSYELEVIETKHWK